jgi:hypothetical protein
VRSASLSSIHMKVRPDGLRQPITLLSIHCQPGPIKMV